jgi:NTE family protein
VGGIYATGRSPAEVTELINGIDWDQVLSGVTPFRDLSFRRKQDAHEVPGQLEFGCVADCSFLQGSILVRKSIWFSIVLHFLTPT